MIKINLARSVAIPGAISSGGGGGDSSVNTEVQRQGGVRLFVMMLFPLGLYAYEAQMIPELNANLSSKRKVLESLKQKNAQAKTAVEEIARFKEDQSRLQKQIDTLEGLRRERLKEVKVMDNLQKDIPEKVWLSKIDFQEMRLTLTGLSASDADITLFIDNLSKSVFLSNVSLGKSSSETNKEGEVTKKFDIFCAVDQQLLGQVPGPTNPKAPENKK